MKKILLLTALLCSGFKGVLAYDPPTMGWSSWNTYGFQISEQLIMSQTSAMVNKGLKNVGYKYINIDDGFFGGRDSEGNLLIHPTRFPNGMKKVVDYIHSRGLKAGIYSDAGKNTCASYWGGDKIGEGVGLYGHEQDDINLYFLDLGFDFIKVDFCGGDPIHNVDRLDLPEEERYRAIHDAIVKTGRTDIRLNVCRWAFPGTWVHEVATSWRISEDIYMGWNSIKGIIGQNLYLSAFATGGKFNDMDMLEVGRGLTKEEDRTHFGMWCMLSSPLLIGCDMTKLTGEPLVLLRNKELIALNQDSLALQAYVVKRENGGYVLVKDVEVLNGSKRAVAFYNPTDSELQMSVDFIDLDLGGKVSVRDLYAKSDVGVFESTYSVTVPAHGTRIYKLDAEKRYERRVYEAETAWLDAYQELMNNQSEETGIYEESDFCSGGAKAGWLGKSKKNSLEWRNVYSKEGGEYTLKLTYITGETRTVNLVVNGTDERKLSLNSGGWSTPKTTEITVNLNKGNNTVLLYNASAWMPDIDCMKLEKVGSMEVYEGQVDQLRRKAQDLYDTATLPTSMKNALKDVIIQSGRTLNTEEEYETLISELQACCDNAVAVEVVYRDFLTVMRVCRENASVTEEGETLDGFVSELDAFTNDMDAVTSQNAADKLLSNLIKSAKVFLKSDGAQPIEGKAWDMTMLIVNPTFDVDVQGWTGSPVFGYNVAEQYNKNFSTYQTLTGLKNGTYTVMVNALYRDGGNDGGKAYKEGTEIIPAKFVANDEEKPLVSLYAHPYDGPTDIFGDWDLKNGYINSMYAASVCFANGQYLNTIETDVTNGRLKIGLTNSGYKGDCWCCFDNFRLLYHGDYVTSINDLILPENGLVDVYSINGMLIFRGYDSKDIQSLPKGLYVIGNRKILVR